jgi:fructokinase
MRIGIDLGGTKIEAIALGNNGAVLGRHRIPTPRGDYEATLNAINGLVLDFERRLGTTASVGVCHPGAVSPHTGLIKNANSTWLNGRPLAEDLARVLARPVRLANDADCFALSEAIDGAGSGAPTVFGVILGTGTGGGIAVGGTLVTGVNAIAGEWGHNPLPWPTAEEWPGPRCYCGRTGCVETFLSGPGFARDYRMSGGEDLSPPEIVARAADAEPLATACLERYSRRLARGLAAVINLLDPTVIVLGGGMSNIASLYERVPQLWAPFVFSDHVATALAPARHGDSSGVRGAAWLF